LGGNAVREAFLGLDSRGWHCLEAIASWPLLRVLDLALLLNWQSGQVAASLAELRDADLIGQITLPHDEVSRRYVLSSLGIRVLAATQGMRARPYGKARVWPVGQQGRVELQLRQYVDASRHTLLALEFMIGLRRLADWWWEQGYYHRLVIWDSHESVRYYRDRLGRQRFLRPDSGGVYQIGEEVYPFLIEVDLDSGHVQRREAKFERYYLSRHRPGPTEVGPMPRLLIICETEGRARLINETLVRLAHRLEVPVLEAYITTVERVHFPGEMKQDGDVSARHAQNEPGRPLKPRMWPGQRQWRRAGSRFDRLTWCFEGLRPSDRHAALRPFDLIGLAREVERQSRMQKARRGRREAALAATSS
jgi:DNA-binding MarR family transcriptional regulator